jgi:hypothetical protein
MELPSLTITSIPADVAKLIVIGSFIVGGLLLYKLIDVIGRALTTRQTEMTRREIAAYVAEGGMTPETAERLLRVGEPENWSDRVAAMVESGHIDSNQAAKLLKAGPASGSATPVGSL